MKTELTSNQAASPNLAPQGLAKRRTKMFARFLASFVKYFLISCFGVAFLLPFLWLVSSSLKTSGQEFVLPPQWWPKPFHWSNFAEVFSYIPFARFYWNTIVITICTVIGSILSNVIVAYGFSRLKWKGRDVLFNLVLSSLMIPSISILIPQYLLFHDFGWINTYYPLIVPAFAGNAFFIFMLRQFFRTIPEEISDATRVDGASELRTLVSIIAPLARPAIATVGVFSFMGAWNDFLGPLVYLNSENKYTLALGLNMFVSLYSQKWPYLMAAVVMTVIPVILLFFFFQKTFLRGITLTGMSR
jgi:ABC-type glycerol-3-phosphate transport system permease component